ncbi:uncharacterized protein (DUF1919 family) [Mesocricetibacter intestinalis]|uniref:Uncharacterized protein (DUF1919 family) n=1 Tax=Mesocricetibacter intestinalis TaxID=1521930 RepID=A0A4R6VKX8_9PAST|nr:DUF1919 domain-containing protein [Mesocricetibacter intestinalis]TDQ59460.1 uncharacterized protein (DUF1919 family) [Mesocricetibacter intestinalis]
MLNKLGRGWNRLCRRIINPRLGQKLRNQDITLLSANCNGALILHDLGLKFNSPFVNLYLTPADFIKYLQRIEYYRHQELHFIRTDKPYPVAQLEDIRIHFMHYADAQEARTKWQQRSARMNLTAPFIMMTDRDGCSYADLKAFDQLPFENKVVFTHQNYPEFNAAFYIKGFEQQGQVGDLFEFCGLTGKKYYDKFDYVAWFNGCK